MWRQYQSHIIVPGNLGTRSHDDEDDDAHFASSPPPMTDLGAASSGIPPSQAPKNTTVNRTSAAVGIIIGALVALGIIAISIFLLYRIRNDTSVDHQAWWWRRRRTAADQTAIDISDKMSTQGVSSDDTSVSLGASNGKVNQSHQNLVPTAPDRHMKPSFLQKIQQVLSREPKPRAKASKVACDMESGNSPESWNDSATGEEIRTSADEGIGRPIPAASISLHTRSSMALGGALAPTGSLEMTGPGPDLGSVSWATTPPKPVPHSHAILRENPLPPLPAVGDPRRDTKFTWMTEDLDPVRHRSIISWIANIQKRQEKRMQDLQPSLCDNGEAPSVTEITAPPPIADPNLDVPIGDAVGSFRFSEMTVDLDIQTPALQTATMAWPVHEAAGQVEVPSIPRSTTRGRKSRPGSAERGL